LQGHALETHDNFNPYEPPQVLDHSASAEVAPVRPWGFWATLGWSLLIGVGWVATQVVVVLLFLGAMAFTPNGLGRPITSLLTDFGGLLLSLSTIFAGATGVGLCALVAWLRKYPPLQYFRREKSFNKVSCPQHYRPVGFRGCCRRTHLAVGAVPLCPSL